MSVIVIVYGFHDRSAHGSATGSQQPSEWPAGSKLFDYLSRCELVSSRSSRTVFIQVIRGRRPRNLFHSSSGDAAKIFMPSALSSIPAINVKKTFMEVNYIVRAQNDTSKTANSDAAIKANKVSKSEETKKVECAYHF